MKGSATEQGYLKNTAQINVRHQFSLRRWLCRLSYQTEDYFATIGFDYDANIPLLDPMGFNAGIVVCVLSETRPQPAQAAAFGQERRRGWQHERGWLLGP